MSVSLVVQLAERDGLEIESVVEDLVALVPRCTEAPDNPDCYANAAWGGGTVELYFQTEEPVLTFEKLRPMLERSYRNRLEVVAWWNARAERWIVLWPPDFHGEFTPHPGDDHEEEEKLEYVEELQTVDDEAASEGTRVPTAAPARASEPEARLVVRVDEDGIGTEYPGGTEVAIRWDEVQRIGIETNDQGPWGSDVWWVVESASARCAYPLGATGDGEALAAFQARFEGFAHDAVIQAMTCTENRRFVCWERLAEN